jgi:murein DD-endopeptidase MepM/ murein hydrolase activator NlpD
VASSQHHVTARPPEVSIVRLGRIAYAFVATALAVTILPFSTPPAPAHAVTSPEASAHRAKADAARAAASRADRQAAGLVAETRRLERQVDAALARVNTLAGRIAVLRRERARVADTLAAVRAKLAAKETEIAGITARLSLQRAALGDRARARYMESPFAFFELLVTSRDLRDLFARTTYLQEAIAGDETVMTGLRFTNRELENARLGLKDDQAQVVRRQSALLIQEQAIADVKDEQAAALHEVRSTQRAKEGLLADTKSNAARLRRIADAEDAEGARIESYLSSRKGAHGSGRTSGGLAWPTPASHRVTSGFGWRYHPILRTRRFHQGIDIGASAGSRIVAAAAGTVIYSGYRGGYGNTVMIDHGNGLVTVYAHQSGTSVSSGARVKKGQTIGHVGSTGLSTGPHLHFETRVNGTARDPRGYL